MWSAEKIEELERQYTPSLFSKRFNNRDELIDHFVKFTAEESTKSRKSYDCHLNISYGPMKREKLDIYGHNLPKSAPLFIFIHGGYWQLLNKDESAFMVRPLYENRIRVLSIDYELCPAVTLEQIVEQVKKCFKWIAAYINDNEITKVAICGHSAGAHLLSYAINEEFMSTISSSVELHAFFVSGIYYLDELRHLKAANENDILSITDDNCRYLSPQYMDFSYLQKYKFNAYVYAGDCESPMFCTHSQKFADGPMKQFLCDYRIWEKMDHFEIMERMSQSDFGITRIVIEKLLN